MNLFRPYYVVGEVWKASDPARGPNDWSGGDDNLVGHWWGLWIVASSSTRVVDHALVALQDRLGWVFAVATFDGLLFAASGALAIIMVRGLVHRQERKAELAVVKAK